MRKHDMCHDTAICDCKGLLPSVNLADEVLVSRASVDGEARETAACSARASAAVSLPDLTKRRSASGSWNAVGPKT